MSQTTLNFSEEEKEGMAKILGDIERITNMVIQEVAKLDYLKPTEKWLVMGRIVNSLFSYFYNPCLEVVINSKIEELKNESKLANEL
jgi:hypothetical protein